MNYEVILACAVTGARDTIGRHPAIPVTPEEIANAAIDAAKAGATVAHCHVRDPQTGKGSRDPTLFREVVDHIRDSDTDEVVDHIRDSDTDVVINLTTRMGGTWVVSDDDLHAPGAGSDFARTGRRSSAKVCLVLNDSGNVGG